MMWLSLSFDHRLVEGAAAAEFLREIKDLLEFPAKVMF
jgi:pyruvate dehydrogenase E2 component (dihydrolipoamide acetyltransferase)